MRYIYIGDNSDFQKTGVYKISIGNHFYIGKTKRSFKDRWNEHITSFETFKKLNHKFRTLLIEHPNVKIRFEIIQISESNIEQLESYYINTWNPDLNVQKPKVEWGL